MTDPVDPVDAVDAVGAVDAVDAVDAAASGARARVKIDLLVDVDPAGPRPVVVIGASGKTGRVLQ